MSVILLLTGCSNYDPAGELTVGWQDGVITYNGKPTDLTEYRGYTAKVEGGNGGLTYEFTLDTDCKTPDQITANTQGITTDNMSKYKDKLYYTEYLGSKVTVIGEAAEFTYKVCQAYVESNSADLVATYVSNYMDQFELTNGAVYCDFGPFTFGSGFDDIKITKEGASVTGTAKVSKESKGCTTPVTITINEKGDTISLMSKTSEKYTYYEYEGYTIQLANGLDINTYIKFN